MGSIPLAKSKGLKKHFLLQKVQDKCKMHILTNECTLFVSLSSLLAHAQIKVKAKELQLPLRNAWMHRIATRGQVVQEYSNQNEKML